MIQEAQSTYRITRHPTQCPADTLAFIDLLTRRAKGLPPQLESFFSDGELIVTRAPGRLDLMGGFGDYSGAMVLELPIAAATHAALQLTETPEIRIVSLHPNQASQFRDFSISLDSLAQDGNPIDYETAHALFERDPEKRWAAYVVGAFLVLMREKHRIFERGARILIHSNVPESKGVSSSAALEVAVMQAVLSAYEIGLPPRAIAFLCQKVENVVAGAPCGVMDQMTAVCGESGKLVALLCQPGELIAHLDLPEKLDVWGLDSGVQHSIAGEAYSTVRTAAFMGYRIIAQLAGLTCHETDTPRFVYIDDDRWNGYLANVSPDEFNEEFAPNLPARLSGREFLDPYKGTTDLVTRVEPDRVYPILPATRHPIYEHQRVNRFVQLLQIWAKDQQPEALGELMYEAHQSYSDCGLGSQQTDELVDLVRNAGPAKGLYGAKITGGGSGGTVAVLGNKGAEIVIDEIAQLYQKRTGYPLSVISGSSPGSNAFGVMKLEKTTLP